MTSSSEMSGTEGPAGLVEHFFRHESGRLVSLLTRVFGWRHWELVEDMVQSALMEALQHWSLRGAPDNPAAWLHRVARNKIIDALRHRQVAERLNEEWWSLREVTDEDSESLRDLFVDAELEDSQLRMIFACCDPQLPAESRVALTLKTLCGFNLSEVARGLLISESTARKRIYRAKRQLAAANEPLEVPSPEQMRLRLGWVHNVLYLMFNEGYCSSTGDASIREDLCEEAARLCHLLTCHATCCSPTTHALLSLMLLHAARFDARLDSNGGILLLEDQDRERWDHKLIGRASHYLARSAEGETVTEYHLEAAIAMMHCKSPSFAETDWAGIIQVYDRLIEAQPSPVYLLNRAIAVGQRDGAVAALAALDEIDNKLLESYHLWDATRGEFYRQSGQFDKALQALSSANSKTAVPAEKELIQRRIRACQQRHTGPLGRNTDEPS